MKRLRITVNGRAYDVEVEEIAGGVAAPQTAPIAAPAPVAVTAPAPAASAPAPEAAPAPAKKASSAPVSGAQVVNCPFPGTILDVKVTEGSSVKKGEVLAVLEAMKMENEIMSPADAKVVGVHVKKGDSVDTGAALISLQ